MILSNGQNMVQPSSGRSGGGGLRRLVDIIARNKSMEIALRGRKDLVTHTTNERIREQKEKGELGTQNLLAAHDALQEKYTSEHPDVIAGKDGARVGQPIRPILAKQSAQAGLVFDSKGQVQTGPVSAITLAEEVSQRNKTKTTTTEGKPANTSDTSEAVKKGFITPEQGADLSTGFNTKYTNFKSKNPNYKGSSDQLITRVNSNVDRLEKK